MSNTCCLQVSKLQSYSCQKQDECGNLKDYKDLIAVMIKLFWIKLQIHI